MPKYDLESRTLEFSIEVRGFMKTLPKSIGNIEDSKRVVKSSGSVGANYREANENIGSKDFLMRSKIARKEAKETTYWLKTISTSNKSIDQEKISSLIQESVELNKILSAIILKSSKK